MVPTKNSAELARRLHRSDHLPDRPGHGGIFQYHAQFVVQ
jgi:hypothetical protein